MERRSGNVVKAEGTGMYRKQVGDTKRYYMSERDIEDEKKVDKKEEERQWEEVYERMRASPEGMIRQTGSKEIEGGMKSER